MQGGRFTRFMSQAALFLCLTRYMTHEHTWCSVATHICSIKLSQLLLGHWDHPQAGLQLHQCSGRWHQPGASLTAWLLLSSTPRVRKDSRKQIKLHHNPLKASRISPLGNSLPADSKKKNLESDSYVPSLQMATEMFRVRHHWQKPDKCWKANTWCKLPLVLPTLVSLKVGRNSQEFLHSWAAFSLPVLTRHTGKEKTSKKVNAVTNPFYKLKKKNKSQESFKAKEESVMPWSNDFWQGWAPHSAKYSMLKLKAF